jgi:septal ring factor EnvC (AmiA/AmiB activator)
VTTRNEEPRNEGPSTEELQDFLNKLNVPAWKIWTARLKGSAARQDPIHHVSLALIASILGLVIYVTGDLHKIASRLPPLEASVGALQDKTATHDKQLEHLNNDQAADQKLLQELKKERSSQEQRVNSQRNQIVDLKSQLTTVNSANSQLATELVEVQIRLSELEGKAAGAAQ